MAGTYITHRLEVKVDKSKKLFDALNELVGKDVLVGVPATVSNRENEPINNATLAYIHEFGAPSANIPPRPFLIPGIKDAQKAIASQFRLAVDAALDGQASKAEGHLNRAGIAAVNAVKMRIRGNIPPPLKPATIRNRRRSRGTKGMRKSEDQYLELRKQGASPGQAQTAAGIIALVNTGQLMRAITWVLRRNTSAGKAKAPEPAITKTTASNTSGPLAQADLQAADRATRGVL